MSTTTPTPQQLPMCSSCLRVCGVVRTVSSPSTAWCGGTSHMKDTKLLGEPVVVVPAIWATPNYWASLWWWYQPYGRHQTTGTVWGGATSYMGDTKLFGQPGALLSKLPGRSVLTLHC